jgi:hypothetical protein
MTSIDDVRKRPRSSIPGLVTYSKKRRIGPIPEVKNLYPEYRYMPTCHYRDQEDFAAVRYLRHGMGAKEAVLAE